MRRGIGKHSRGKPVVLGLILCVAAMLCQGHETLDLSKIPREQRFTVALQYVVRAAQQDFHTLKGAKIELHGDVKRVWYQANPALPGAADCRIPYNNDVYQCEWRGATAAALDRTWQELTAAADNTLQSPWMASRTPIVHTYELPAERTYPALRLELRRPRTGRGISVTIRPVRPR